MNKTIAFLIFVIALLAGSFGYYARNNKPILSKQIEIQRIVDTVRVHDTIYKAKVSSVEKSFKTYSKYRDSVLSDTVKIDSVLNTKVDTTKDIRISAIVLADSLSTCNELLNMANGEVAYKDSVLNKIEVINNKKDPPINWRVYSIVGASALVIGILIGNF